MDFGVFPYSISLYYLTEFVMLHLRFHQVSLQFRVLLLYFLVEFVVCPFRVRYISSSASLCLQCFSFPCGFGHPSLPVSLCFLMDFAIFPIQPHCISLFPLGFGYIVSVAEIVHSFRCISLWNLFRFLILLYALVVSFLVLLHFSSRFAVFPPTFRFIALWTSPNQHPKPKLQFRRHPPPKIGFTI